MCIRFRPLSASVKTKNVFLVASCDGTVSQWHMSSSTCLFSIKEEDNQIYAVDYSGGNGDYFATAGSDSKVRVYDNNSRQLLHTLQAGGRGTTGHSARVYSVKYRPGDDNVLVTGGWDNTLQFWDTRVGHSVRSIFGPHLCGDAIDIKDNQLLTASHRPEDPLQLWDFGSGQLMHTLPWRPAASANGKMELLYTAQFSPRGDFIAAGG